MLIIIVIFIIIITISIIFIKYKSCSAICCRNLSLVTHTIFLPSYPQQYTTASLTLTRRTATQRKFVPTGYEFSAAIRMLARSFCVFLMF